MVMKEFLMIKTIFIGYDYTQGHNTSRSDFQTFIGNLNYSTDEENNKKVSKISKNIM